jgi:shikimate kinase
LERRETRWNSSSKSALIHTDTARPLLKTPDPKGTLERLLSERDPLYREAAHVVVDTGSQSAAAALARVLAALKAHGALAGQDG